MKVSLAKVCFCERQKKKNRLDYIGWYCMHVCALYESKIPAMEVEECPGETTLGEEEAVGGQARKK